MVSITIPFTDTAGQVDATQEGAQEGSGSIGFFGMRRVKRDGRNPSTGARTSRKYGLSIIHSTGIAPLAGAYSA